MQEKTQNIENMLFSYGTTYRTDYRFGEIREYPATIYKTGPSQKKRLDPVPLNVYTMTRWKGDIPPFSLSDKPKDIVRTNPTDVQQRFEKSIDLNREKAQKNRPRVVMTPAVSMDDIEDPRAREILCTDMYTTSMTLSSREPIPSLSRDNVKAPLLSLPGPANPFAIKKLEAPFVSPEWRKETVSWDAKQLRAHCDTTEEFWLRRNPPKCNVCDQTAKVRTHRKRVTDLKTSGH